MKCTGEQLCIILTKKTMTETKSYLPHFAINNKSGRWIRMDDETPHSTREKALERKKWLVDEHNKTGYRIIKHKEKFYLYERKA